MPYPMLMDPNFGYREVNALTMCNLSSMYVESYCPEFLVSLHLLHKAIRLWLCNVPFDLII